MFEAKNKTEALKHIVHIAYNDSEGSGVIVPIKGENYSYVLTAKHTFGKDEREKGDDYGSIEKTNIETNKIVLTTSSNLKLKVLDILIIENEPKLDFLILKIDNDSYIDSLKPLDIYEEDFNYCLPYGYPQSSKDGNTTYEPFNCEYKPIVSSDKLEVRVMDYINVKANKGTVEYMSGISGAGVFVENYNKDTIYLVGIVIQGTEEIKQNLVCLDLEKISKKINDSLSKEGWKTLEISGAEWKNKFGFDMSDLNFEKEIEEFKEKSKNKFIEALKNVPLEKFVDKFDTEVKSNLKKEEDKFQKISESYLYIGMNFHQLQSHKRATHYFNKAIEYGGDKNKSYLLDAKSKREEEKTLAEKSEQEKELILGFINTLYQEMYEYEEQLKKNSNDESLKKRLIECYKELIEKLNFFDNRNEEILDIHNKSIKLYANFDEYDNMQEQIFELKDMINLSQKFEGMKNQVSDYKKEIEGLNKHIQLLSTHVTDKTLLNKINYKVFNTDKKLDEVSINLSQKIDGHSDNIDKKLDIIIGTIKKTNNKKIDSVLEKVCTSNRALVSKIQTMYHQNDRVNKKAKIALKESIDKMNEKLDNLSISGVANDDSINTKEIKDIIEKSNWNFYRSIKKLSESEQDLYNRKLLEMSIAFTKREHELHIENLENIIDEKNREVLSINLQLTKANEWIDKLNKKYESQPVKSEEVENKVNQLREMNKILEETSSTSENSGKDLINLEKYKHKIKQLEESIFTLKGRNEELKKENKHELEIYLQRIEEKYEELGREKKILFENNFAEILKDINSSIDTSSSEPLDTEAFEKIYLALEKLDTKLDDIEDNYELKIDNLNERFTKLISNPKNEKRLRRISRQIHGFENKLEEIKREKRGNPKITLHLLESNLEKIESIMNKRRLPVYHLYYLVRSVLVGGILLGTLVVVLVNEPYKTWVSEINYSKILTIFKDIQ